MKLMKLLAVVGITAVLAGCGDSMPESCTQLLDKVDSLQQKTGFSMLSRADVEAALGELSSDQKDLYCKNALAPLRLLGN